jgi:hypothetical protein
MKKIMPTILSVVLASFLSAGLFAAETDEQAKPAKESSGAMKQRKEKTGNWSKDVRTPEGEKVGTVVKFFHDKEGNISFATISRGGFLGISDEKIAVPYGVLSFNETEGHFVADLTQDQLAGAPRLENEAKLNDRSFAEEIYKYFGVRPYWKEEGSASKAALPGF